MFLVSDSTHFKLVNENLETISGFDIRKSIKASGFINSTSIWIQTEENQTYIFKSINNLVKIPINLNTCNKNITIIF